MDEITDADLWARLPQEEFRSLPEDEVTQFSKENVDIDLPVASASLVEEALPALACEHEVESMIGGDAALPRKPRIRVLAQLLLFEILGLKLDVETPKGTAHLEADKLRLGLGTFDLESLKPGDIAAQLREIFEKLGVVLTSDELGALAQRLWTELKELMQRLNR